MMQVPEHLRRLGLHRNPFPPTPDANSYFRTGALQRDVAETLHCLLARKGMVLLTGEVGTGKSTFIRYLLNSLPAETASVALIFNTFLQGEELLNAILADFGLATGDGLAANLARLNTFLLACRQQQRLAVLIVDDAQNLSRQSLELVRLLSSLETGQEKLLQIVLAGQPELADTLAHHQIRQLDSRITLRVRLTPLTRAQVGDYVAFRLEQAGAADRLRLGSAALSCLYRITGGNPRHIHRLMDRCLYGMLGKAHGRISVWLLLRAARDGARRLLQTPRRRALIVLLLGLGVAGSLYAATHFSATGDQTPWLACIDALPGGTPHVANVPAAVAQLIRHAPDSCITDSDAVSVLAWPSFAFPVALGKGDSGAAVQALQQALQHAGTLRDRADGVFGSRTHAAVRLFQARYQLPETGRADPLTRHVLAHATGHLPEPGEPSYERALHE